MRSALLSMGLLLSGTILITAAPQAELPFGKWSRISGQPILWPQGQSFESAGVFNPTVIKHGGKFMMLYRAQDKNGVSSLGYASSEDGVHFIRRLQPVMAADAPYEKGGGVEDPRVVEIGNIFYLTYTGYHNKGTASTPPNLHGDAQLCLATSKDLIHWKRHGVIVPAYKGKWNVGWTKSGAIIPQRIRRKFWMYYLGDASRQGSQMGVAYSTDLLHWTDALDHPILSSRPGTFDSRVVEPGPAPIVTSYGVLLIYNGADESLVYRTGWVLFDKTDPTKVLARSEEPIFEPVEAWEKAGQVPNVVFVEGLVRDGNRWLIYYGGADKYVGVATAPAH